MKTLEDTFIVVKEPAPAPSIMRMTDYTTTMIDLREEADSTVVLVMKWESRATRGTLRSCCLPRQRERQWRVDGSKKERKKSVQPL